MHSRCRRGGGGGVVTAMTTAIATFIIIIINLIATTTTTTKTGTAVFAAAFELPPLPYGYDALEPYISRQTLEIHHGKHHKKYVDTTTKLIQGTFYEILGLEEIIKTSYATNPQLFNNAAQSWNHEFYWNCMKPPSDGDEESNKPTGRLAEMIASSFGSLEKLKQEFATAGNSGVFGSGWAWLVYNGETTSTTDIDTDEDEDETGKESSPPSPLLYVIATSGAENPLATHVNHIPILTMDVWEHAYYLDYQNMRATYVDTFFDKLVNWKFVAETLERAINADNDNDNDNDNDTDTDDARGEAAKEEL